MSSQVTVCQHLEAIQREKETRQVSEATGWFMLT